MYFEMGPWREYVIWGMGYSGDDHIHMGVSSKKKDISRLSSGPCLEIEQDYFKW
jgi:hypothetical protein